MSALQRCETGRWSGQDLVPTLGRGNQMKCYAFAQPTKPEGYWVSVLTGAGLPWRWRLSNQ